VQRGEPPLVLDAPAGRSGVADYMRNETRFRMVERVDPQRFRRLASQAGEHPRRRVALYEQLSHITLPRPLAGSHPAAAQSAAEGGTV
jgi:pyruvate-ferredoxin/flavodoxin oxidoreductase